jgi:acetyltransferase
MEQTKIYKALKGVRGRAPVDLAALESLLVSFSQLVMEQRWIKEIDINPLLVSPDELTALDARILLFDPDTREEDLPQPAIRPYPTQYVGAWTMRDGAEVNIRPIRPEDEPLIVKFHEQLSDRSVYMRYFQPLKLSQRTAHERLTRICFIDYDREMALVAERLEPGTNRSEILAVTRLSRAHSANEAELTLIVKDEFQHLGLGKELVKRTIEIARVERLSKIVANILQENREMQTLCENLGFTMTKLTDQYVCGELQL